MAFQVQVVLDFHTFGQLTLLCNTDLRIPVNTLHCPAQTSQQQQSSRSSGTTFQATAE